MKKIYPILKEYPLFFATIVVLIAGGAFSIFGQPSTTQLLFTIWGIVVVLKLGREMIETLREGSYGIDLLAVVAIISTLAVSEHWASMIIVLMLTGGEALEAYAAKRAKRELSHLLDMAPKVAHLEQGKTIPIHAVKIGDRLLVKPQEIIPVDATLASKHALVDESSLTGESRPVEYAESDALLSGSINGDSAIVIVATQTAAKSEYQKIIQLVEAASSVEKSPFVRLADRYAVPFTIIAFGIAGLAWYISGDALRFAQVLVVATPCPLILAAPIALVSGMSQAAKRGIIIKSGAVIEKLSRIKSIAFDKTGTLTHGTLEISQLLPVKGVTKQELFLAAATAEQQSSHIIAKAITTAAAAQKVHLPHIKKTTDTSAFGVEAIAGNQRLLVGKLDFLQSKKVKNVPSKTPGNLNGTVIFVAKDGVFLGTIELTDTVRDNAESTLASIHRQGISDIIMLTGDNEKTAKAIAKKLNIDRFFAECLPADKVRIIKKELETPNMMVGDGVNDAPVLATASVGVAMGAKGSTAASETADVVIMLDDISRVSETLSISKRTLKIATQSIMIGIAISVALMIIAAFGYIPAVVGALLQEVVDVVVIINALRALR
ncbi:MAG TPA: heavy metal translocating P-type ATPase [Candidatus Saccharibacteria bacterium]|nr:heavy metal translocating P-type ATPase [Candidatus Saccharibacteria bacterium]HMR38113.1 heavy metal translocating P-type ATPase [Candidatus Saccharibacteria bacterium]